MAPSVSSLTDQLHPLQTSLYPGITGYPQRTGGRSSSWAGWGSKHLGRLSEPLFGCQTHKGSYQNHSRFLNCGDSLGKSDVCMASPSSGRALEQRGSEDEPQGEETVSILRFIIHWTDPGRRQPLLGEVERRGGSVGG